MATKVSDLVRGSGGYMSFIDYTNSYRDDNKEFLRGDMWEFSFLNPPKIVYYPGDTIFKKRLNTVNVSTDSSVNGFEKRMRGNYVIFQKTGQSTSGSLTLSFVDKEDQAISYFVDDWKQKISDRDTKYSFRKDDLVADCQMVLTNSSRIPVRTLKFYNCIIQDAPLDESGVDADGSDRSDVQLSMNFEHYEREFNNI
jgi:hypothetical protein